MSSQPAGLPLPPRVVQEASRWYVLLLSGRASDEDRRGLQAWREADPDHDRAWAHLARMDARLREVAGPAAYQALSAGPRKSRRRMLAGLVAAAAVPSALGVGWAVRGGRWSADHATAAGEQRELRLADGTEVLLNTDTALDVHYGEGERRLALRRGEILVSTGHAGPWAAAPFRVSTPRGRVTALGTRFSVYCAPQAVELALLEGRLEIEPSAADGRRWRLRAGEAASFDAQGMREVRELLPADTDWVRGEMAVDDMPLGVFLQTLARYRPGVVSCDPEAAALRLSGLFPIRDTDRVLAAVERLLPVTVSRHTPYWVRVRMRRSA